VTDAYLSRNGLADAPDQVGYDAEDMLASIGVYREAVGCFYQNKRSISRESRTINYRHIGLQLKDKPGSRMIEQHLV
jgi:hypothetical protein